MINFPTFHRIDVKKYGLFPGCPGEDEPGLHVEFLPGLTLIIGINGLGKTTLITLLYRMLTGPNDIPALSSHDELGSRKLASTPISPTERNFFLNRVADRAAESVARLSVTFGTRHLMIERALSTLKLSRFSIDDIDQEIDEDGYQKKVMKLAGVGSFGDFILMLRYLVFYFEDRRALVWDPTAQRQILRMLFLPPEAARKWTEMERAVLEQDSRMRNLRNAVTREQRSLSRNITTAKSSAMLRKELKVLENQQKSENKKLEILENQTLELDSLRQKARLDHLKAEQNRETRFRKLERTKLMALDAQFPRQAETGKYILAHLMSDTTCLVCGSQAPDAAKEYISRLNTKRCVVCQSGLAQAENVVSAAEVADRRVRHALEALEVEDRTLTGACAELKRAEDNYKTHVLTCAELRSQIADLSFQIDQIVESLPHTEVQIREQRDGLSILRTRVEIMKNELNDLRDEFRQFVSEKSKDVIKFSSIVEETFSNYAQGFLAEEVRISRSSHSAPVGQGGSPIGFPSYALDMTGTDFNDRVRRAEPDSVSESQREFIDLAFRMALMKAATTTGSGSLVIDAPESSLDAVFAKRAADVLVHFSSAENENRLIVTSNLVEGSLIPTLIEKISADDERERRLIDLLKIARPTKALEQFRGEYDEVRKRLLRVV